MAFHLRKFLSADSDEESPPSCYACTTCDPDDCFTPPPQTVPHHRIPSVLIIMICVFAFAVLIISYLALSRYRNRPTNRRRIRQPGAATPSTALAESEEGFRDDDDDEEEEEEEEEEGDQGGAAVDHHVWYIRTVGFPQSVIDSIAMFRYKSGEGLIEGTDCSVCLNEFEEDETLRLLPKCSHAFHLPCIDTWLRAHKNCPVCRAPIMAPNNVAGSSLDGNRPGLVNQALNESETRQDDGTQESGETRGGPGNAPSMPIQEETAKIRPDSNPGNGDFRVLSDLSTHRVKMDQESQPVRRSASLDLSSTSTSTANKGHLDKQGCKNSGIIKLIKSASFGRSLQKGPISMKRSISLNGKRLLRKNDSRRQKPIYMHA